MTGRIEVALQEVAHARSGDKGDRLNIALVCHHPAFYAALADQITPGVVAKLYSLRRPSKVMRYDLPRLAAFNFVLDHVLDGGVNASLGLDGHGKTLSFVLLSARVEVDPAMMTLIAARQGSADAWERIRS